MAEPVSTPRAAARAARPGERACRFCAAPLSRTFVDLGMSPLCERILRADQLDEMEPFYPLHRTYAMHAARPAAELCPARRDLRRLRLLLVVLRLWVEHADVTDDDSHGRRGGHEPAWWRSPATMAICSSTSWRVAFRSSESSRRANVADVARDRGIPTVTAFFGEALARARWRRMAAADLVVGNNVFAHVPDINDFTAGLQDAARAGGLLTIEVPYLLRLIERTSSTRSTTSTSVLHAASPPAGARRHGLRVVRRGGAADPRWLAPALCPPRRARRAHVDTGASRSWDG